MSVAAKELRSSMNLARVDLVSLQLAVACAGAGSISAAAAQCNLSIMGASQRLRRLEDAYGKPLFFRHRRGLLPTDPGKVLVDAARRILDAVERMDHEVRCTPLAACLLKSNTGRRPELAKKCPCVTGSDMDGIPPAS